MMETNKMLSVAVTVTNQVCLVASVAFLEKKYGSLDDINVIILIAHLQITDHESDLITDMAKNVFLLNGVIDLRGALTEYMEHRKKIKENIFKFKKINIIRKDLEIVLQSYFNGLQNIDLLLIRKPSRFPDLFAIKYINPISISRIEDGSYAILSPYIPAYYRYISYVKKIAGVFPFVFYRLAGCGDEMTFFYKFYKLPQVHSIQDGSIDPYLLLTNFKKIKQQIGLEKFKEIKLLFLGTYDASVAENSINAIRKDNIALELLKKKYSLNSNEVLYKPHPKTFINMTFEDYSRVMNVSIASEKESSMMAEYLSIYMDELKWVVSGAGSYSLFVVSSMLENVEPVMIRYKDNSHTKKQYDAAINKYIKENKVESIVV
jgi:hypothetical protein